MDPDTGEVLVGISPEAARELTDRIKVGVEGVWLLVKAAYESRAWAALGYSSWDDYCTREFGASRIRLPREERAEVVASLRESGLSLRAIAAATGDSEATVRRSLPGASFDAPDEEERVTGTDGKTYPARPTVMERLEEAKNNHPVEPIPFKSRAAIEATVAKTIQSDLRQVSESPTPDEEERMTGIDVRGSPRTVPCAAEHDGDGHRPRPAQPSATSSLCSSGPRGKRTPPARSTRR